MTTSPIIVWFRYDLRLSDNPALVAAIKTGAPILPVYILDTDKNAPWKIGAASRVWLHHSLLELQKSLGGRLVFGQGHPIDILHQLISQIGVRAVFWNRCYEPHLIERDKKIKATLIKQGVHVESFSGNLLYEPWTISKSDGTPYRVFTPFWQKGCHAAPPPPLTDLLPTRTILSALAERTVLLSSGSELTSLSPSIDHLGLLPARPRWDVPVISHWQPGEAGAQKRFQNFLDHGLRGYKQDRNRPDLENVSRLSPHLHFGEISVHQIYHAVNFIAETDPGQRSDADCFLSELGWREFSHHLLYHFPTLPEKPLQAQFNNFPWIEDQDAYTSWTRGMTGVPIVDAGMRELWETGYMHNRVRMIVGSFLVKNLLTHWRKGEDWFWDTLFDADLANNAASWQWIAGCGADAAPYFRIFNPELQASKFDPDGTYIRRWVPEFGTAAYPKPKLEHIAARNRALAALKHIQSG